MQADIRIVARYRRQSNSANRCERQAIWRNSGTGFLLRKVTESFTLMIAACIIVTQS
jgi:hypothetical protein